MNYVIGVDLGGTQIRAALVRADGLIVAHVRAPSPVQAGPVATAEQIVLLAREVWAALPAGETLAGLGLGGPGPLDPVSGVIFAPPNLPNWGVVPLRGLVAERIDLTVELGNDANAAALAEWRFGAGKGTRHLVYLTISTGLGGGVIVDGQLLLGRLGLGGELGFLMLDAERGVCWEDLASGTALGRAAATAMPQHPTSYLHTLATPTTVNGAHVAQAAAQGDALARTLMDREAHFLGLGFASVMHTFSPEILVVGGSVVNANPNLLAQAREIAYAHVINPLYRDVPIVPAQFGDQAGVLGAAALFWQRFPPA
jgi:glucokinase